MTSRYTLYTNGDDFVSHFTTQEKLGFFPNFNIAPTNKVPIIIESKDNIRHVIFARWGLLPEYMDEDPMTGPITAIKSELFEKDKNLKNLINKKRCIIPANGFYEWKRDYGFVTPFYIHNKNFTPMAFGGVFDVKKIKNDAGEDEMLVSVSIITVPTSNEFSHLFPRFPLLLQPNEYKYWLAKDTPMQRVQSLIAPIARGIAEQYPVTDDINDLNNNYEALCMPIM